MFTAFMVALTLTSVANVLVTMAIGPLLTALLARVFIGHRIAAAHLGWRSSLAGAGHRLDVRHAGERPRPACCWARWWRCACRWLPRVNWTVVQRSQARGEQIDLVPSVLVGAVLSSLLTLPLACPFVATGPDLALLAFLGWCSWRFPAFCRWSARAC